MQWFNMIGNVLRDPAILPKNVYHMDETGVMLSMLGSVKVVVSKNLQRHPSHHICGYAVYGTGGDGASGLRAEERSARHETKLCGPPISAPDTSQVHPLPNSPNRHRASGLVSKATSRMHLTWRLAMVYPSLSPLASYCIYPLVEKHPQPKKNKPGRDDARSP